MHSKMVTEQADLFSAYFQSFANEFLRSCAQDTQIMANGEKAAFAKLSIFPH